MALPSVLFDFDDSEDEFVSPIAIELKRKPEVEVGRANIVNKKENSEIAMHMCHR